MVKFKWYYDTDKETEFLNEMSKKGYALSGFFLGFYHFDQCRPGEYIYQIDITEGLFRVSNDYREFMRDMGVEIVCLWGPWVILRKRAEDGPFVLYTDVESRIEHYTKIKNLYKIAAVIESICILVELLGAVQGVMLGYAFSLLLAALSIGFIREIVRINGILAELKGRIGIDTGAAGGRGAGRMPSGFLPLGLFLGAIAFLIPATEGGYGFLKGFCQGAAIVFIVCGIAHTAWRWGK